MELKQHHKSPIIGNGTNYTRAIFQSVSVVEEVVAPTAPAESAEERARKSEATSQAALVKVRVRVMQNTLRRYLIAWILLSLPAYTQIDFHVTDIAIARIKGLAISEQIMKN